MLLQPLACLQEVQGRHASSKARSNHYQIVCCRSHAAGLVRKTVAEKGIKGGQEIWGKPRGVLTANIKYFPFSRPRIVNNHCLPLLFRSFMRELLSPSCRTPRRRLRIVAQDPLDAVSTNSGFMRSKAKF